MMTQQQMELGLGRPRDFRRHIRRQRRLPGARWWFAQMHALVQNTPEWQPPSDSENRQPQPPLPIYS